METGLQQIAKSNGLGQVVREYGTRTMLFTGLGLFLAIDGLFIIINGSIWYGLFFLICGGVSMYYPIQHAGVRLFLYEHGLIYKKPNDIRVVKYKDIVAFWQSITRLYIYFVYIGSNYSYTVKTQDGTLLRFQNIFQNIEEIGSYIREQVFQYQMPDAHENYNKGNDLIFGPITINKNGLTSVKGTLFWTEVSSINVRKGKVLIRDKNSRFNWTEIAVSQIPNFSVFCALVNEIIETNLLSTAINCALTRNIFCPLQRFL